MRTAITVKSESADALINKILNCQQNPMVWIADRLVRALLDDSTAARAGRNNHPDCIQQQLQQMREYAPSVRHLQHERLPPRVIAILQARSVAETEAALLAYRQTREVDVLRQYGALLQFAGVLLPPPQRDKIRAGLVSLGRQYERLGYLLQDTELTLARRDDSGPLAPEPITQASGLTLSSFEHDLEMIDVNRRRVVLTPASHTMELISALGARGYDVLGSRALELPAIPQYQARLKRAVAGRFSFAANA